ncbi:MAG: bifunctional diaminohydroxyphosphoribosylaminopyrimidine deaminase/5-amino-6-(5-phosphoribosylamino)uracil reductase RibD [Rickettsiales bacterium]|nr:bifunctional diaminohydroxyphosphoribosylaminopyrimidine deaminase/5-amino-6-(5-phosphoribosylamino)uracil reductase RibD [Rickettsiales bacterium]
MIDLQEHQKFMKIAIELAKKAIGTTFPNPPVGCVIVKNGVIISACNTQPQGRTHAEVSAINKANKEALSGATMYVTMEPCSHFGKSPPCVNSIIPSGIKKVFVANKDANPKVNGAGILALRNAGIDVVEDFMHKEAMEVNLPFFRAITEKLPFVTLKLGTSLDGKIALNNGKSKWITSNYARNYAQILRYRNDAILVGINTIKSDNPSLTLRLQGLERFSPLRIVIDKNLEISEKSEISQTANKFRTIIFCSKNSLENNSKKFENTLLEIISVSEKENKLNLLEILNKLAEIGVSRLLIEGGKGIATSFLKENLIDEIQLISSAKILGDDAISTFGELNLSEIPLENFSLKSMQILEKNSLKIYRKCL